MSLGYNLIEFDAEMIAGGIGEDLADPEVFLGGQNGLMA